MPFEPLITTVILPGGYEILTKPTFTVDDKGWDLAEMSIQFRGTQQQLLALFDKGTESMPGVPGTARMICRGVIAITMERWGYIWARVGWVGYMAAKTQDLGAQLGPGASTGGVAVNQNVQGMTHEATADDIEFPQDVNGTPVYADGDFLPNNKTATNTDSGTYWRARITDYIYTRSYYGIVISETTVPPSPPVCTAGNPGGGTINWTDQGGSGARRLRRINYWPGKTTNGGWVRKQFSTTMDYSLGGKALYTWRADFEWRGEYSA